MRRPPYNNAKAASALAQLLGKETFNGTARNKKRFGVNNDFEGLWHNCVGPGDGITEYTNIKITRRKIALETSALRFNCRFGLS